jgi:hypothetical protein
MMMTKTTNPRDLPKSTRPVAALHQGALRVRAVADRRSWGILRRHFSARATEIETAYGSCRSRGRQERAHRSLENRTARGFPQLPQAPSSATKVLPMFPVYFVTYLPGCSVGFNDALTCVLLGIA